jgi:hypothetical protein
MGQYSGGVNWYFKDSVQINYWHPPHIVTHIIPQTAIDFIGIPYKLGGNPQQTGTTDNSYLFFSIYSLAAQKAGLSVAEYLIFFYSLNYMTQNHYYKAFFRILLFNC